MIQFFPGAKIHAFTLVQRVAHPKDASPNTRNRWRCECTCGKRVTVPEYYFKRPNPKKDCGCSRHSRKNDHQDVYRIWLMMHKRTEDPNHVSYHHYGGRGIRVCAEWHKSKGDEGFYAFLDFIGPRPSKGHSVDRVNNELGYQPYQLDGKTPQVRWATKVEQRANQRPK